MADATAPDITTDEKVLAASAGVPKFVDFGLLPPIAIPIPNGDAVAGVVALPNVVANVPGFGVEEVTAAPKSNLNEVGTSKVNRAGDRDDSRGGARPMLLNSNAGATLVLLLWNGATADQVAEIAVS